MRRCGLTDSGALQKAYFDVLSQSPARHGTPHTRAVAVIACGAARRRRRAAIPSGADGRASTRASAAPPHKKSGAGAVSADLDSSYQKKPVRIDPHPGAMAGPFPPGPSQPRPARYTAVATTHALVRHLRRAAAHGHANASTTRDGGIRHCHTRWNNPSAKS